MEKNYRIHTNIGDSTVLKVDMHQDVDFFEVLSLKLKQGDIYKLDNSNYGVIVGRVLANDAFGIPNAKLSVFIGLETTDSENTDITNVYPYNQVTDKNNNIRYNLLLDEKDDECYKNVGTFPNKRLVLDDNTVLEIFDKYYKYTTVTNQSGDYMLYNIPTGQTTLHVDIDLSDIGVLSQTPRDFMYKGYDLKEFDNAVQFKDSTSLDSLKQIYSQNQSVFVYSFYGEEGAEDIGITRCDVSIDYKIEPTCVFMGALFSDSYSNNINHRCTPSTKLGKNSEMIASEGTIEMIRKTTDGKVEEFHIQGNQLIDGDGVWCYQIPMNLDYVGTDEYGNICATNNPNKGIPTRARVRFRMSMNESPSDSISRHRAKMLVPNNPKLDINEATPHLERGVTEAEFEKHYNFGSATLEEDYRDLYWNKVYSIKSYIPRVQTKSRYNTTQYLGLKGANYSNNLTPFPYNNAKFTLKTTYKIICIIMKIVISMVCTINVALRIVRDTLVWSLEIATLGVLHSVAKRIKKRFKAMSFIFNDVCYTVCAKGMNSSCKDSSEEQNEKYTSTSTSMTALKDAVQDALADEFEVVSLDLVNDWVNGSVYFPLWFWKKTKKKKYLFGLFTKRAKNSYCDCDKEWSKLRIVEPCLHDGVTNYGKQKTVHGLIKEIENKDGLHVYYYSCGNIISNDEEYEGSLPFVRLFATDIILLGSFSKCDIDGIPNLYDYLPSTTSNIPSITTVTETDIYEDDEIIEGTSEDSGTTETTGMDWLSNGKKDNPKYGRGLLFSISCENYSTLPKTCFNLDRISEYGVSLDSKHHKKYIKDGVELLEEYLSDGLITKIELEDSDVRAMFATLNHNGLDNLKVDTNTGYKTYNFRYLYPMNFDGKLKSYATNYTIKMDKKTIDAKDDDYILFRYGDRYEQHSLNELWHYNDSKAKNTTAFTLTNNSYYFYFGINEGNTAIDKFNKLYNAKCVKNNITPFNLELEITPNSSCLPQGEYDYNINVNLTNIQIPYSYKLYDIAMPQEPLLEVDKATSIDGFVINKAINDIELENSTQEFTNQYRLEITDGNGTTLTETFILVQPVITLDYEIIEFGDEYLGPNTIDESNYGELIISAVTIDGVKEKFTVDYVNYNERICIITTPSEKQVQINFAETATNVNEYATGNSWFDVVSNIENNGNSIRILFQVPCTINAMVKQICYGELLDTNKNSYDFTIPNGKMFDALINDVPMRFMKSKMNWKFGNDSIENPESYTFAEINDSKIWRNYVDYETEENSTKPTQLTKQNIFLYELQSITNICLASYFNNGGTNTFSLSTSGGKNTQKWGGYLNYDLYDDQCFTFNEEREGSKFIDLENSMLTMWVGEKQFPSVSCDSYHPHVVFNNYTFYRHTAKVGGNDNWNGRWFSQQIYGSGSTSLSESNSPANWKLDGSSISSYTNPLMQYSNNKLSNYFVAYANNAKWPTDCIKDKNQLVVGYDKTYTELEVNNQKLFETQFVDARLSQRTLLSSDGSNVTGKTCLMGGRSFYYDIDNPIQQTFDAKYYNLINYEYTFGDEKIVWSNWNQNNKRLYNVTLNGGNVTKDWTFKCENGLPYCSKTYQFADNHKFSLQAISCSSDLTIGTYEEYASMLDIEITEENKNTPIAITTADNSDELNIEISLTPYKISNGLSIEEMFENNIKPNVYYNGNCSWSNTSISLNGARFSSDNDMIFTPTLDNKCSDLAYYTIRPYYSGDKKDMLSEVETKGFKALTQLTKMERKAPDGNNSHFENGLYVYELDTPKEILWADSTSDYTSYQTYVPRRRFASAPGKEFYVHGGRQYFNTNTTDGLMNSILFYYHVTVKPQNVNITFTTSDKDIIASGDILKEISSIYLCKMTTNENNEQEVETTIIQINWDEDKNAYIATSDKPNWDLSSYTGCYVQFNNGLISGYKQ